MKRVFACILAAAMLLSMTGCELLSFGGGSNHTQPPAPSPMIELLNLSRAELKETLFFDYYILRGITEADARAYEQTLIDSGYAPHGTGWVNDTQELNFASYLWGADTSVAVCFFKDTLVLCQSGVQPKDGDIWLLAGAPRELLPEDSISKEGSDTLPDWSAAQTQTIGEYEAQVLVGTTWDAVNNYGLWLMCRKGYQFSSNFDNPTIEGKRYLEAYYHQEGDQHIITVLAWEDDTAVLIDTDANDFFDEYALWNWFGTPVSPGMGYLEDLWLGTGIYAGSGNGFDSTGFYYSFSSGADASDFESQKQRLIDMGFVEEVTEVHDGGYMEYTAARYDDFGGYLYPIWYQLILDGDYLELEVGYSVQEGSHKD